MAKTYKKISGTWYPIKKIFKRISGTWNEVKKLYKKISGTWQVVHSGAVEYTFVSSITATDANGILLSSYVNPTSSDEFIITINSGVVLSGSDGVQGANNASSAYATYYAGATACKDSLYTDGRLVNHNAGTLIRFSGTGGNGGNGNPALNLSGFGGKKVTIINNGTLRGGNGGNGGQGALTSRDVVTIGSTILCASSGNGGTGGLGLYNPSGATIVLQGNTPINGTNGTYGVYGWTRYAQACSGGCCFLGNAKVTLVDGTVKPISEIKIGDCVLGAFGESNTVTHIQIPDGTGLELYDVNGVITTSEHGIVNGKRDGFVYVNINDAQNNVGQWHESFNGETLEFLQVPTLAKEVKTSQINERDTTIYTMNGEQNARVTRLNRHTGSLYHLVTDGGSKTFCVDGVFVSGWCDGVEFLRLGSLQR